MARPGQPTKYRPEYCESVIALLNEGAAMEEIAFELQIHLDTLYEWIKVHPEFSEAIKYGKAFSKGWWMKNGRTNIHNKEFNSTLWYMNMKNRFGWCDKQEVQQTTDMNIGVQDGLKRTIRAALDE